MEISSLPDEVLCHIFQFTPGFILLRIKRVCMHWHDVIGELLRNPRTWKDKCFAEIPEDILLDLTASSSLKNLAKGCSRCGSDKTKDGGDPHHHSCPKDTVESDAFVSPWLRIYMIWWRSKFIGKYKELRTHITTKSTVGALKINGDYILGATKVGTVEVWNHLTGDCVAHFLANYYNITDLKLIPLNTCGINSLPQDDLGSLWTTRLVTGGIDRTAAIYDLDPVTLHDTSFWKETHSTKIVGLGVWDNMIVSTSSMILCLGHKVLDLSKHEVTAYLNGYKAYPQCIDFWKHKIISGTTHGQLLKWDLTDSSLIVYDTNSISVIEAQQVTQFSEMVIDIIYRDKLILCITGDGLLCVSTDEGASFRKLITMEELKGSAKLMMLKGNIFALCTSAGMVFLYHLERYEDFKTLDLSSYKACIHTGSETIYDMDISDDGDGPMLAVSIHESTVCVVKWFDMDS